MHRALQIPEMVDLICSQVSPDEDSASTRVLARLARTAKIFLDPALNSLWSSLCSFLPFLGCMPADLWCLPVQTGDIYRLNLVRPIVPADWDRPLFYLNRGKSLEATLEPEFPCEEVFAALCMSLPTEHFFPNLRRLDWIYMSFSVFPYLRTLLSPRLTRLGLHLTTTVSHLSLVPTIAHRCPYLTEVTITCQSVPPPFHSQLRTSVSLLVRGLQHIEKLDITDLDEHAFMHLGSLPTFKSLVLENFIDIPSFRYDHSDGFPALTNLELWPNTLKDGTSCIMSLTPNRLKTLAITVECESTFPEVAALFRAIADNIPHTGLTYLEIEINDSRDDDGILPSALPDGVIEHDLLRRTLCHFGHLTYAELQIPGALEITDVLVLELARAWPDVEQLHLNNHRFSTRCSVTLNALRALAEHCPKLTTLGLQLDARVIPRAQNSVMQTNLRSLYVGFSPILDPPGVGGFLFGTFPALTEIEVPSYPTFGENHAATAYCKSWRLLKAQMTAITAF
ncbi:hypothetical protein B0H16DRAFT_835406 [Mycena metata]|uniref:F-box domain-containing protein n=1 Tax=Mycena metata TaxID=1033252 RepID=A0AAD7DQS0_9AGAR|nr:hypothetical protein B0H16DRAFT_835406 [Mycena metata]